jgi:dienelactone hydrolase
MQDIGLRLNSFTVRIFLLGVIAAFSLHGYCLQFPTSLTPSAIGNEVTITHWRLIGPFRFSKSDISADNPHALEGGLNHDFLADIGHPEEGLTADAIEALCAGKARCTIYSQHGAVLPFDHIFPNMTYAVIYASSEITSTEDADVGLELGSDDGVQVWLNGHLLLATRNDVDRAAFKYTHLLPVHLKKGHNLLVMKVDQKVDTWALISSFMPLDQMRQVSIDQAEGHLLANRLLKVGDHLQVSLPPLSDNLAMHLSVSRWSGSEVIAANVTGTGTKDIALNRLHDGYYNVTLQVGNTALHDAFYLGNPSAVYDAVYSAQQKYEVSTQEFIQREPILHRYKILTSDQYSHPDNPDWQKKLLMVLNEGLETLNAPVEASWSRVPGMHLREYISKVDGTTQYYLLFLPYKAQSQLPLVLVTPYAQKPERPFLESSLLAWPDDLEDIQNAADLNGVAVALTDGRGNAGVSLAAEADAFEVLNDLNNSYSLDTSRLYLYGTCEGGRRALLLAEHYPGVFAAVGVFAPTLSAYSRSQLNGPDDVFASVDKLLSTPVFMIKGEFDDYPPTAMMEAFQQRLVKNGSASEIKIILNGMHKEKKVEQMVFPFLVKHHSTGKALSIAEQYRAAISRTHPQAKASHN